MTPEQSRWIMVGLMACLVLGYWWYVWKLSKQPLPSVSVLVSDRHGFIDGSME